ncbi:MAG: hypothetical protein PHH30_02980 [Bacteroidales bacterium]|nr:hypothetical protein [Bacteroidales bacterium]
MQNLQLKDLYSNKFSSGVFCFLQQLREKRRNPDSNKRPAYPLLIKLNEEAFSSSDLKIMIFGQETNSWERGTVEEFIPVEESYKITERTVDTFMSQYIEFFNSKMQRKGIDSPFWTTAKKINKTLSKSGLKPYIIWNNIYKIGNFARNKNRPSKSIRDFENSYFPSVINNELEILKPDIIILLTGPEYEARVDKILTINKTEKLCDDIDARELANLSLNSGVKAIRTYHPNFLFRNKKSNYIDLIIKNL